MVSHPACCCSVPHDHCNRSDLLAGLEDFRLMGVARSLEALVLDVESYNQLVGCSGCGVIAQGHRRVVEAIDGPWAGIPAQIPWHNTVLDMPRTHLPDRDLHRAEPIAVCPQGAFRRPDDPSAALRGSHAGLDNSRSRGTPCDPTSSRSCSLTRLTTGGVLNPTKNTTKTSHNELLHQKSAPLDRVQQSIRRTFRTKIRCK